ETLVSAALEELHAAQRFLAIRGHDRHSRHAASIRVAGAPRVLAEEPREALAVLPRLVGDGVEQHLDDRIARGRDDHQSEPQPATETPDFSLVHDRFARPSTARTRHGEIDAIGQRQTIDALQHEREIESELQLDDDRWLVAPGGDDVTSEDLAF